MPVINTIDMEKIKEMFYWLNMDIKKPEDLVDCWELFEGLKLGLTKAERRFIGKLGEKGCMELGVEYASNK